MVDANPTAFPVNIQSTNTVGQLKQAIKAELDLNVLSMDLTLWQVNISDGASEEEMSNVLSGLNEENKLSPLRRLQPLFSDGAAEAVIHIFVKLPPQPVPERMFVKYVPGAITPFAGGTDSSASTTNRAYSATPASITPWNDFIENVQNMELAEGPSYDVPVFFKDRRYSGEIDIQFILRHDLGNLTPHQELTDAITQQLLSGALAGPLDSIRQIYGYMYYNGFRYGVLTTFNHTWFIIRPEDNPDSILVSPSISFDETEPTLLMCYLWFIRKVNSDDNSNMDAPDKSEVTKALRSEERTEAKSRKRHKGTLTQRLISAISPGPLLHSHRSHVTSDEDIVPAFKDMKLIASGNRPRTFKALWMGDTVFVKKCDMWNERQFIDELRNEIDVYGVLQALQGVWIPRMKLEGTMNGFEVVLATESAGNNISNERLDPSDCNKIQRALAAVHNCGVLHGDLKPDNIVVRRDGFSSKFMIIDFGLSTFTTDEVKLRCEKEELDSILAALSRPRLR
ncbi:hypothetical protein BGZ82_011494 [Podila clonocystis]|nr:hypothetical protein BGZ82_011494 [Podila clonocystis]